MPVERATPADYDAILAGSADFWGERDVRALHHPMFIHEFGDTAFVVRDARNDSQVEAYLFGFVAPTRVGYVHVVGVRTGQRRRGLARTLYDAFEQAARERGAVALKAITRPANEASIAFHRALGMSAVEVPSYSGAGQDRVVFWRELASSEPRHGVGPTCSSTRTPRAR